MKFNYATSIGPNGYLHFPLVEVIFRNPKNGKEVPVLALVDSGATDTMLRADVAELIGIDVHSGKRQEILGIAGKSDVYAHDLIFRLKADSIEIPGQVQVMEGMMAVALLGQNGLFLTYKVIFNLKSGEFELRPFPK